MMMMVTMITTNMMIAMAIPTTMTTARKGIKNQSAFCEASIVVVSISSSASVPAFNPFSILSQIECQQEESIDPMLILFVSLFSLYNAQCSLTFALALCMGEILTQVTAQIHLLRTLAQ